MNGNDITFSWPPLESDPQIFNKYCSTLGLPSNFHFEELFSLDDEFLSVITTKPLAIIINFERGVNPREISEENILKTEAVPFYMLQEGDLDNACGIIAALHSIGSNLENIQLKEDSILYKFFGVAKGRTPKEISTILANYDDFKKCHMSHAQEGQSNLCENQDEVKCHFISFIHLGNKIVELDGIRGSPILIEENVSGEEFLTKTANEIKRRLERGNITDNLSMLYLTE